MKLILSSCDFSMEASRKCILDHLPRPIEACRVLFIPNEKATSKKIESRKYHLRLTNYGFAESNITVFDETRADDFKNLALDVIYVSGGNTFLTLNKIRACGFDRALVSYIQSGVAYIGGSAGAHLVTGDLSHVAYYDPAPSDMENLAGLGLLDRILLCHYQPQREEHAKALIHRFGNRVILLTDQDSIVVERTEGGTGDERYTLEKG